MKTIKVYSTTTCPYCVMEKEWLEANKIQHTIVYVDSNQEEAVKMVESTGQMGVPVTEITDENGQKQFMVGFNPTKLSSLINN
jgi:glutaredoxin 3